MNQPTPFEAFTICYSIFALVVLLAVTLTASSQPQLGLFATIRASVKVIEKVMFTMFFLLVIFLGLLFVWLRTYQVHS